VSESVEKPEEEIDLAPLRPVISHAIESAIMNLLMPPVEAKSLPLGTLRRRLMRWREYVTRAIRHLRRMRMEYSRRYERAGVDDPAELLAVLEEGLESCKKERRLRKRYVIVSDMVNHVILYYAIQIDRLMAVK